MAGLRFLLDTNILSEPLAGEPNTHVMARIEAHSRSLAISSITWQELLYGMLLLAPGRRRQQIHAYLFQHVHPVLPVLAFDSDAATWQANQRARLRQVGKTPSYADSQIAAIAASNELVLVTRNIGDFHEFEGLRVENWFDPEHTPDSIQRNRA
jgi:tRNA(fMet)-specific endonuclease VapC